METDSDVITLIAALEDFSAAITEPIEFCGIRISSPGEASHDIVRSSLVRESIGSFDADRINKSWTLSTSLECRLLNNESVMDRVVLGTFICIVNHFLQALWLVEDNSAHVSIFISSDNESGSISRLHDDEHFSGATGSSVPLWLGNEARKDLVTYVSLLTLHSCGVSHRMHDCKSYCSPASSFTASHKQASRLSIAMNFVRNARKTDDIGMKLLHYCSALEALMSTDRSELSHKVAERTAWLLGNSGDHRKGIYETVKQAYNVRSVVVHGDRLTKNKQNDLFKVSNQIDHLLRLLIRKSIRENSPIVQIDHQGVDLDSYFFDLVMGCGSNGAWA